MKYCNVKDLDEHGCARMPQVEEVLASYSSAQAREKFTVGVYSNIPAQIITRHLLADVIVLLVCGGHS